MYAGSIQNTPIGSVTASTGAFTTLTASSTVTLSPANASVSISPTGTGTLTIAPATAGTINNMSIGATTASTGRFTTGAFTQVTGTAPFTVASTTVVTNLNADLLDGQNGSWYQDWANITNKPDPVVTVTLTGDVTGSANTTLTDLASGTISVSTTIAANSVALGTDTTGNYMTNVTAGGGITITHTPGEGSTATIAHTDTSSQASVDNSNGVVIQDITLDTYGHITAIGSADLDNRYLRNDTSGSVAGTVTVQALNIDSVAYSDTATLTTTATTSAVLASFSATTYGSGEILIQATQGTSRHITKLLIVHNGTVADATEYGKIITGNSLFSVNVDISGGNVRVLVTPDTATSTVFKTTFTLLGA